MKLTKYEANHILHWAGYTIEDKQHWGNGRFYFPIEEEIIKKIKSARKEVKLELMEVNMVYFWAISYFRKAPAFMGEDIMILKKMLDYYKSLDIKDDFEIEEKIIYLETILKHAKA